MPVDEHDERNARREDEPGGEDAPVRFAEAEEDEDRLSPLTPEGRRARWRRVVNRRNALWTGVGVVALFALVAIVAILLYRTGQVDRFIAQQIVDTFAKYGIRAEIGSFETEFTPRTAELKDVKLYDAKSGAPLGEIDRILATVRIEDMWALSLRREVSLEALEIEGLELWVKFDEEGRSNFANLSLPEPEPNRRILFSYSTAHIKIKDSVIHYDDRSHSLSGEARNLRASIRPEDSNEPEESRMNLFEIALSDSTFVYDGRPVNDIDVEVRGRANQTRAEISELVLRSPVAEARLEGALDDWRALRYQMRVNASVDLTQVSDVLQPETVLRGAGRFQGVVSGEGERYRVEGEVVSDALAADGIRLQGLNVNAAGGGSGESYEFQGRAVAELLSAGDFTLNSLQLAGGVTGTGADFRWLGELRAAALRSGATSVTDLILRDAVAEISERGVAGSASSVTAGAFSSGDASASGLRASGVRFRREESGRATATVDSAGATTVRSGSTVISNVRAEGVGATVNADESAGVSVERVSLGGVSSEQFRTGGLNIAGVRLSIAPNGAVEGESGDINVGAVSLADGGRAENVALRSPRFKLEPGGRYRASADLSLGGGVLGEMALGAVRGQAVVTNTRVELNDFVAEIFNGRARGDARIATARGAQSEVRANFEGVDLGGLIAAISGRIVPLTGAATGDVNLSFPGTNYEAASGTLNAQFTGETGRGEDAAGTPVTGELRAEAVRGNFRIERMNLRAGETDLNASGRFSLTEGSDLALDVASKDASELQRILVSTGLLPQLESQLEDFGLELQGALTFKGGLRGDIKDPLINGRFELASLNMRGVNLGSISFDIETTQEAALIKDGRLAEPDGGGARFAATIPRTGENNISVEATLEDANAGNLIAALVPGGAGDEEESLFDPSALAGMGPLSGTLNVKGLPGAMEGSADLSAGPGVIAGEPYRSFIARANFGGSRVNIESLSLRFDAGTFDAHGFLDFETQNFNIAALGKAVRLDLLTRLFGGGRNLPPVEGLADFKASVTGSDFNDARTYRLNVEASGKDITVNGQPAGDLTLTGRTSAENKFTLELTTGVLGAAQTIVAEVDLSKEELPTKISTTLTGADLTPLFRIILQRPGGQAPSVRVTGRATGTLVAKGNLYDLDEGAFTLAGLEGRAEFSELVVYVEDVPLAAENPLIVLFKPNEVTFEKTRFTGPGTDIVFGGTAAIGPGGRQNVEVNGSLNLRVIKISPNAFLGGAARVGVRVTGSYEEPQIRGTAEVAGGSFATLVANERLQMTRINGEIRFNADQAEIRAAGRLGRGTVGLTGGALLEGFVPTQFRLNVSADGVTVPFPQDFETTADANLQIRGTKEGQIIEGLVQVRRAEYTEDIDLADFLDQRRDLTIEEGVGGAAQSLGRTTLDLQVEGRDALVVRNNLGDIVGSISLRVRGTADDPLIAGRITSTRGSLNFRNNRFEIQRAIVDLPPRRSADPIVNILAEGEIRGYRVRVGVAGPLSGGLQTTLSSDPPLPQADVVALITTGQLSSGDQSASVLSQTGVGTATSLLAESLINAPVRRATDKLFGLNRFEIDPLVVGRGGASPTARLTVGRQINRNLSVTYSTNVTGEPDQVIAVEYRVSDRLFFVAQYRQGSQNALRTQSNDFSFEVRLRKRY